MYIGFNLFYFWYYVHCKCVYLSIEKKHLDELQQKTDESTGLTLDAKEKNVRCTIHKLNGPLTAPKTYSSILNRFLNNRKIPAIPPLLVNGDIITNFSEKAD